MIARRAEEFEHLFRPLYEVDLSDSAPLLKLDKRNLAMAVECRGRNH